MLNLPILELVVFSTGAMFFLIAAVIAVFQVSSPTPQKQKFLKSAVLAGLICGLAELVLRAAEIGGFPLTGIFESMMLLSIVFGLLYLILSVAIKEAWFSAVSSWVVLILWLLTGIVASPAGQVKEVAATPWALAHGLAMILAFAAIAFSAANAFLALHAKNQLKKKRINKVIGRVPSIEKLQKMNLLSLKHAFLFLTFGITCGIGMAVVKSAAIQISLLEWLTDIKIVFILALWVALGTLLVMNYKKRLTSKTYSYFAIAIFTLVMLVLVFATATQISRHDFQEKPANSVNSESL